MTKENTHQIFCIEVEPTKPHRVTGEWLKAERYFIAAAKEMDARLEAIDAYKATLIDPDIFNSLLCKFTAISHTAVLRRDIYDSLAEIEAGRRDLGAGKPTDKESLSVQQSTAAAVNESLTAQEDKKQPPSLEEMVRDWAQATDAEGDTALHKASSENDVVTARILIAAGANINKKCHQGWTPLIQAVKYRKWDMVRFLLENGADASIHNNRGEKPLDMVPFSSEDAEIILLLRKATNSQP